MHVPHFCLKQSVADERDKDKIVRRMQSHLGVEQRDKYAMQCGIRKL